VPRADPAPGRETDARPLLDALQRNADAEARARQTAAAAEVAGICAEADARLERQVAAATAEKASALSTLEDATRAACLQRVARETLTARAEALDHVFAAAAARIETRRTHTGLAAALAIMISDALSYLPDGPARLRCQAAVAALVGAAIAGLARDGLEVCNDDTVPLGVMAETADRSIVVDATFARRLGRERRRLAIEVANQLEGVTQ
jgi:vacuolar-type H+-ATPase subunit E/Vma4